ncbi:gamma-glutamyltranspeptidase/glutathione hydrolase [Natranaerovirga pectinivora]|uniref:Glutathione hydrolase proenzyme n=1 Tax=Natranaerovirga pectinivora TaxID=682400 RepID=A0A4R3MKC2_9FIRM|nr:gamma-glutamyltransferase [Natranaerovirga pectinivora]TCT12873.1 gamma-glutamyltranspeptidase/glutathione hydrolase [Natranaerovirga pectinivora]
MVSKQGDHNHSFSSKSPLGMVSTASTYATEAGVQMLEKGGNAIDAAVAAAFCLGVTEPQASGLGGQSMALVYFAEENRVFALDGSSRAPFSIQPSKNPQKPVNVGIKSTTVPSTPATLGYMHEKYGKLPFETVIEPAISAAKNGFVVSSLLYKLLKKNEKTLAKDSLIVKNFFTNNKVLKKGNIIRQPELAECMMQMSRAGWMDFYIGKIGNDIIKDMETRQGLINAADLSQIPFPVEREVLSGSYRGYDIFTFPPPGAGRVLVQLLNILENFPSEYLNPETPIGAIIFALAFRFALTDRQKMPIHPDFYLQSVNKYMSDKAYAKDLAQRIYEIGKFSLQEDFTPPPLSGETTHLSVVDKEGNAVGITQSIELVFGSKTMADGLGFFYNNYLSAFEYKNMTHPYYLLPGGKPWSSVAPTLIFENGKPRYLLGSPGSARISTALTQVISRLIDNNEDMATAIAAPRFHSSHTGKLIIEQDRFDKEVIDALKQTGFEINRKDSYSFYLGCVQGVQVPINNEKDFLGVADLRRDGSAKGPNDL